MIAVINSTFSKLKIIEFCLNALEDKRPNAVNMDPIDWENKPHTLMYCLYKEKRFDGPKSGYLIKIVNGEIVAGMGWYPSDLDSNIYALCRAYTAPNFLKGLSVNNAAMTNEMQFAIEDYAMAQGYKGGCISVEEYNKKALDKMISVNDISRYPLYQKVGKIEYREPGVRMRQRKYAGMFHIRNSNQHLCYHLFDSEYEQTFLENIECHRTIDD